MDLEYAGRNGVKITEDAGAEKAYFEHGDETIEAHTEGTGAPHVLAAADVGVIMTDAGSAALTAHMLPAAAAGKHFHFQVTTTNGIRVVAAAGDDIRVGNQISKDTQLVRIEPKSCRRGVGMAIRSVDPSSNINPLLPHHFGEDNEKINTGQ